MSLVEVPKTTPPYIAAGPEGGRSDKPACS